MLDRDGRDKVLIVLHQDHSTPGRVGTLLARRGVGGLVTPVQPHDHP